MSLPAPCDDVLLLMVATDPVEGYHRMCASLDYWGYRYHTLGMGDVWDGGDMAKGPGGGKKVRYLQAFLRTYTGPCKYVVFSDCYDVVALQDPRRLLDAYRRHFEGRVVFAAEKFCWPDASLAGAFPPPAGGGAFRFLNSGGFMGPVAMIRELVTRPIQPSDDDQLYYTHRYLESQKLAGLARHVLDHESRIFQTLSGCSVEDFELDVDRAALRNARGHAPALLHGNGGWRDKLLINQLANYAPRHYRDVAPPPDKVAPPAPADVAVAFLMVAEPPDASSHFTAAQRAFLEECLRAGHPVRLHNPRSAAAAAWFNALPAARRARVRYAHLGGAREAFIESIRDAARQGASHCLLVTNAVEIKASAVAALAARRLGCVAPLLRRPNSLWSNVWMEVDAAGFYKRSFDYIPVVRGERRGVWNAAYVSQCILLERSLFDFAIEGLRERAGQEDADMSLCAHFRAKYRFMYADNTVDYGLVLS